jgi:VWFA-related protein
MINGFTTDPAVLLRTIAPTATDKGIEFSPLLITPDEKQGQEKLQDQLLTTGNLGDKDVAAYQKDTVIGAIVQMRQFITDTTSFNDDMRVRLTLQAMDQLARYLSPLPGRKNIIWFSASFPLSVGPDYNQADAYRMLRDYSLDVRATAQRLATARVAVYPIDARRFYHDRNFSPSEGGASQLRNGYYRTQSIDQGFDEVTREHDTMDQIAEDTGGLAIYNTGDLKRAMGDAIESGRDYYTLAYDPAEVKRDGKFHKITVKFDQPGYKLLYRHGYTAQPLKAGDVKQAKPDPKPTPEQRASTQGLFRAAMDPGAPPISEILFRVQMAEDPKQPTPADKPLGGNAQLKWPVRRYAFGYAVDVGQMDLVLTPDGHRHGILLAMAIAYDQLGGPRNSVLNTETLDLAPEDYAKALHEGLPFYQELDIPPGDSTVRVGIYDGRSQKMGATEFPLTVKMPAGQNATK